MDSTLNKRREKRGINSFLSSLVKNMDEQQKRVQQRFGPNAAAYASSRNHAQGESLQRLITLMQPQASWRVLDVATGAGHTALAFAPLVREAVASDITPQMLSQAEKLASERGVTNLVTKIADAERLPFEDATFDAVTCRIAPHHFNNVQQFVSECARALKAGGLLGIADNIAPEDEAGALYIDDYEKLRDPSHVRCLPPSEWKACFANAGLSLLHEERVAKQIGFEEWCSHQKTPADVMAQLREVLLSAPAGVKAHLKPAFIDDVLNFSMVEGVFVCRKPE
jgi:ubiquinone/menaquinone biosynthesis C-methylase UbiE